jgi:UDP-glucose 6-dehydrogenase
MNILPEAKNGNIYCLAKDSEMWKYASNFLLTAKILMANLIYDVCEEYGVKYDIVQEIAGSDDRIWPSHLEVVFEWWRWANGHCFPKDMATFHEMYNDYTIYWDLLLEAMEMYNAKLNLDSGKQIDIITSVLWEDFINTCISKWGIS